ncbi:hypothetical protein [Sphingobacterium detergens]|uniref:Outer membrane beta-barrel porin/alpha-amylase n=1 Tax=Sphingobacterium detergens TaxID=1145106 RepID=A0A420B724_SPHD1|nr:hypothetical protein [Sphingobacterium detergens]RKE52415.1 hypothetical protein DFQ12_2651 [Sphingobacterium detergens]
MRFFFLALCAQFLGFNCCVLNAQQSIWEGGNEKMTNLKEKGTNNASQVQQWRKHIQEWGLEKDFNHSMSLGLRLNTNGWSGGIYYLKQTSAGKKTIWQLHFSGLVHEKEIKQQRTSTTYSYLTKNTPYSLGKINSAYTLQLGYGQQEMLFPALLDGNLSLSLRYAAGPALALLKPYYLKLLYLDYIPEETAYMLVERFSSINAEHFLNSGYILGSEKWSKGLGETRFIPGLFAEIAIAIEPERPKSFVKTITIGGNVAYYSSKIELMAERRAYPYQASFFVGLAFGKRWK